jgi:hypothetical protein
VKEAVVALKRNAIAGDTSAHYQRAVLGDFDVRTGIIAVGLTVLTAGCTSFDYPTVPQGVPSATIRLTRDVFSGSQITYVYAFDNPDCVTEGISGFLNVLAWKTDTSRHVVVADGRIWIMSLLIGEYYGTGADAGYPQGGYRPAFSIPFHGQKCMTEVAFSPRPGREYIVQMSGTRTELCQMNVTEADGAPVDDLEVMVPTYGCRAAWKIGPEFAKPPAG